jgi:GNAT superfamily N-acetyltransferase
LPERTLPVILRKAELSEIPVIWIILQQAIEQRRLDGSQQWQNGYPNEKTVRDDITKGNGFVLVENNEIIAYAAIIFDIEPAYTAIKGKWLTNNDYVVVHRVATSNAVKGKGVATQLFKLIEELAIEKNVYSIKVDTNFDNVPMLKIVDRLGYTYCGEVEFSGSPRRAYEKVLAKGH